MQTLESYQTAHVSGLVFQPVRHLVMCDEQQRLASECSDVLIGGAKRNNIKLHLMQCLGSMELSDI